MMWYYKMSLTHITGVCWEKTITWTSAVSTILSYIREQRRIDTSGRQWSTHNFYQIWLNWRHNHVASNIGHCRSFIGSEDLCKISCFNTLHLIGTDAAVQFGFELQFVCQTKTRGYFQSPTVQDGILGFFLVPTSLITQMQMRLPSSSILDLVCVFMTIVICTILDII